MTPTGGPEVKTNVVKKIEDVTIALNDFNKLWENEQIPEDVRKKLEELNRDFDNISAEDIKEFEKSDAWKKALLDFINAVKPSITKAKADMANLNIQETIDKSAPNLNTKDNKDILTNLKNYTQNVFLQLEKRVTELEKKYTTNTLTANEGTPESTKKESTEKADTTESPTNDKKVNQLINDFETKFPPEIKNSAEQLFKSFEVDMKKSLVADLQKDILKWKPEVVSGFNEIISSWIEKTLFANPEYKRILRYATWEAYNKMYNQVNELHILKKKSGKFNVEKTRFLASTATANLLKNNILATAKDMLSPTINSMRTEIINELNNKEKRATWGEIEKAILNKDKTMKEKLDSTISAIMAKTTESLSWKVDNAILGKKNADNTSKHTSVETYGDEIKTKMSDLLKDMPIGDKARKEFAKQERNEAIQKGAKEILGWEIKFGKGWLEMVNEKGELVPIKIWELIAIAIGRFLWIDVSALTWKNNALNIIDYNHMSIEDAMKKSNEVLKSYLDKDAQLDSNPTGWRSSYDFDAYIGNNIWLRDSQASIETMKGINMDKYFSILDGRQIPYSEISTHKTSFAEKKMSSDIQKDDKGVESMTDAGKIHYKNHLLESYLMKIKWDTTRSNLTPEEMTKDLTTFIITWQLDSEVSKGVTERVAQAQQAAKSPEEQKVEQEATKQTTSTPSTGWTPTTTPATGTKVPETPTTPTGTIPPPATTSDKK